MNQSHAEWFRLATPGLNWIFFCTNVALSYPFSLQNIHIRHSTGYSHHVFVHNVMAASLWRHHWICTKREKTNSSEGDVRPVSPLRPSPHHSCHLHAHSLPAYKETQRIRMWMMTNVTRSLYKQTFSRMCQVTRPCCNSRVLSVEDSPHLLLETLQRNISIYTSGYNRKNVQVDKRTRISVICQLASDVTGVLWTFTCI